MTAIDSLYSGNWTMEREGLEPIVKALEALGYRPADGLWPAALRISRAPALADDILSYAAKGQPSFDIAKQEPAELFRPLPGGHTVASLTEDFSFQVVGSFLMASLLVVDEEKAKKLLAGFIEKGLWKVSPDGKKTLIEVPAARRSPRCPHCSKLWGMEYEKCPGCGKAAKG